MSETEVARIERDDFAVPETLGPTLDEGKRLMTTPARDGPGALPRLRVVGDAGNPRRSLMGANNSPRCW
jgi:hypothetical protein